MVGTITPNFIPKIYHSIMKSDECLRETCDINKIEVGVRIKCNDSFGIVKYIGEVDGHKGMWYGIDWDEESRGKHDGCVDGVQYFVASKPTSGSFIRPNKVSRMQSCAEAIKKYYGEKEDDTTAALRRSAINEWKREMKAPFIQMVGFESIQLKQGKFDALSNVFLHDRCVAVAGDLAELCPNLLSLDLSQNLLCDWNTVADIVRQLPQLEDLDLSKNRLALPKTEQEYKEISTFFRKLKKLNLSYCSYDWNDILLLATLWPKIDELVVAFNQIVTLSTPPCVIFDTLSTLKLDGNCIRDWSEILKLGTLRNLNVLSVNDCDLQDIRFGDTRQGKVDDFANLQILFLSRNRINNWRSISELDKLKKLCKLYFLKNPILATEDYDTCAQLIIAKIGNLQEFNGTEIPKELRRGSEYDYLKRYGLEWKNAQNIPEEKEIFAKEHCRFQQLLDLHGIPDDSLIEKKPETTSLTSKLLEIILKDENTGATVKKKFPSTMAVQKLAAMAFRLFAKSRIANAKTGMPRLYCLDEERGNLEMFLDNDLKELSHFSIKSGDVILVRWS